MTISDAQFDLRRAYVGGGPGMVVSGLFWLLAAYLQAQAGTRTAFLALFVGGMMIYPASLALRSVAFGRAAESPANPLGRVALESTVAMLAGLGLAWLVLPLREDWVFPFAAIAVGSHFFAFRTAYGDWRFWLLGGLLTASGIVAILEPGLAAILPALFGCVEILFGLWLGSTAPKEPGPTPATETRVP